MRSLGMIMMMVGLISVLVTLMFQEFGSAALDAQDRLNLDRFFYVGVAFCVAGAAIFSLRVLLSQRQK